ncbi:MAG: VanZ family protein, partial [Burkholderiales bacterium]
MSGSPIGTILAAAALLALVQFASLPASPKILGVINNFAHGPVFGLLALVLLAWLRRHFASRAWLAYAAALVLSAAAGVGLEILQIFSRRDASLTDALADTLGAGSFLCLAAFFDRSISRTTTRSRFRRLALLAAVIQFSILLIP